MNQVNKEIGRTHSPKPIVDVSAANADSFLTALTLLTAKNVILPQKGVAEKT